MKISYSSEPWLVWALCWSASQVWTVIGWLVVVRWWCWRVLPNQSRVFSAVIKAPVSGRARSPRSGPLWLHSVPPTTASISLIFLRTSKMRLQAGSPGHSNISHIIATFFVPQSNWTPTKKGHLNSFLAEGQGQGQTEIKMGIFPFTPEKTEIKKSCHARCGPVWRQVGGLSPVLEMSSVGCAGVPGQGMLGATLLISLIISRHRPRPTPPRQIIKWSDSSLSSLKTKWQRSHGDIWYSIQLQTFHGWYQLEISWQDNN